jgi:hypothetical protein
MIERQSLAPGSPKDDGGDDGVDNTVILLLMAKTLLWFLVPGKTSISTLRMQCAPRRPARSEEFDPPPGPENAVDRSIGTGAGYTAMGGYRA